MSPTALALAAGAAAAGVLWQRRRRQKDGSEQLCIRQCHTVKVDQLIVGCSTLAGCIKPIGEEEAVATVARALERGFDKFDTAPHYGCGLSEERLGIALRRLSAEAGKRVRVWTKVGRLVRSKADLCSTDQVEEGNVPGNPGCIFPETPPDRVPVLDYSFDGVAASHRDSLRRLGIPAVTGLRVHDAESEERFAAMLVPETGGLAGLASLRRAGVIEEVSAGMNDASYMLRLLREAPDGTIDTLMIAGVWNLLDQSAHELLCECQRRGVRVHVAGIYASGLLAGGSTYRYAAAPPEMVERCRRWEALAAAHGATLRAAAMAFAFLPAAVEFVAVGVKSPAEVDATVRTAAETGAVPAQLWREAKAAGLLPTHIPVP